MGGRGLLGSLAGTTRRIGGDACRILVSPMRRFCLFDAYDADNNPWFSTVFARNGRIRNAGIR